MPVFPVSSFDSFILVRGALRSRLPGLVPRVPEELRDQPL